MTGPGGPGSAADRALAQRLDQRLLKQQVLVANFPDAPPDVNIVRADPGKLALVFCEAGVSSSGSVDVGRERLVALADIGSVEQNGDGVVSVLGHASQLLVRMHFETPTDERTWIQGLRAIVDKGDAGDLAAGGEGAAGDGSEVHVLHAKSRQLQNQIGSLEALNERREGQLNKMVQRLDGAMQMLSAVQDMCTQQRKVIQAQKVAITELSNDLGLDAKALDLDGTADDEPAATEPARARAAGTTVPASGHSPGARSEESPGSAQEDAEETDTSLEMKALLDQADQMQQLLTLLESRGAGLGLTDDRPANGDASSLLAQLAGLVAGVAPGASATSPGAEEEEDEEEEEEENENDNDDSEEAVRERLRGLEAEKERFAGLLRNSQQEHQELLEKLHGMRSLMAMLGLQEGAGLEEGESDSEDVNN